MKGTVGLGARATALLLIAANLAFAAKAPVEKILLAPHDAVVRVTLQSGERIVGRLVETKAEHYVVLVPIGDSVTERKLDYKDTKSVSIKKQREGETLKQASANAAVRTLTVFGIVFGVGLLTAVASR